MIRHTVRRVTAAVIALVALVIARAGTATAMVGPDDPNPLPPTTQTITATTVDWTQLAWAAAIAVLVGVAATIAVQHVLHRTHHSLATQS